MKQLKISLIFLGFVILMALAAIKIGDRANWNDLSPQRGDLYPQVSSGLNSESQPYSEWKAGWEEKIADGVTLTE